MRLALLSTAGAVLSVGAVSAFATFLPRNDLHLQDRMFMSTDMDEAKFNAIINDTVARYVPIVTAHGATLKANNLWTNSTVNASANQSGKTWMINMYGGLARRPEITPDGFAMVVCHELGHHLGGYSFYGNMDWAASEGQSDYFATQSCARVIWSDKKAENAAFRTDVHPLVKAKCDAAWKTADDQNLCYRTAKAGESLALLLGNLNKSPVSKFDTPDPAQVKTTYTAHPKAQCRLDTYFAGSICPKKLDVNIIPGRKHPAGQLGVEAEGVAAAHSCMAAQGFKDGARPRCWFKPLVENPSLVFTSAVIAEEKGNGNGVVEPGEVAQVGVRLRNGTGVMSAGIEARLSSNNPGVAVVQGDTRFNNIAPGQTVSNALPLLVKVAPNMPCGTAFELSLQAHNQFGGIEVTRTFAVGKFAQSHLLARKNEQADFSGRPFASQALVADAGPVNTLYVKLDVDHANPSDVQVLLQMPNGQTRLVRDRVATRGNKILETISVAVPNMGSAGNWALLIKDSSGRSAGRLNSWELVGTRADCANPQSVTQLR